MPETLPSPVVAELVLTKKGHRETQPDTHTHTGTDTDTDRDRQTCTDRHRQTQRLGLT